MSTHEHCPGVSDSENTFPRRRPLLVRLILSVLRIVVATVSGLAVYLFLFQSRFIYFPENDTDGSPQDIGLEYEDVMLAHSNGQRIHSWYVPAGGVSARGTILFCHGNAGNIGHRLESIQIFNQLGFNVFIFDYRGYGNSDGSPSETGTYEDAELAWNYLVGNRLCAPEHIIIFGRSLGGAVAARTASVLSPALLILESCFSSAADMGRELYPFLPVDLLIRYKYPTRDNASLATCPVIVIHSPDDEIIPFSHGRAIYEAVKAPKEFITIRGGHNEGFLISREHYQKRLAKLLERYYVASP